MSIQLSIIIVNYNVKAFIEQCLYSVIKATEKIEAEIFVVDNNSVDDSVEMIKSNFPETLLIQNDENKGFAYACNQALRISTGKYALLLNPDTVIKEDSFDLCKKFMDEHSDAGALGVRMINGKGDFLLESKRSLPTPASAFYKVFGISSLFPNSQLFGKYQLKFLDENETHKVDVLSGAFMFIRKSVLDEIGLLDENFFMYGEDIDLSYRIKLANYNNYYFPKTTIIHYKGESTKKSSIKYVKVFYNAMLIFAKKHYKGTRKNLFHLIIQIAIYFRAGISLLLQFLKSTFLPSLDFLLIYLIYTLIIPLWENYKFTGINAYSPSLIKLYVPSFILIWFIFLFYFKAFKEDIKISKLFKAIGFGTAAILVIYSLLPESLRYSRVLILFGAIISIIVTFFNRMLLRFIKNKGKGFSVNHRKKALLIGNYQNKSFLNYPPYLDKEYEISQIIKINSPNLNKQHSLNNLKDIIRIFKIKIVIFFIKDLATSDIINSILNTKSKTLEFKIILPSNSSMISSKSVIDLEKIPEFRLNLISDPINRIKKRLLDILIALLLIPIYPIFFIENKPFRFFRTIFDIIGGKLSWVSYHHETDSDIKNLPIIRKGIYSTYLLKNGDYKSNTNNDLNQNYAKNYKIKNDLIIIFRGFKSSLKTRYKPNNK